MKKAVFSTMLEYIKQLLTSRKLYGWIAGLIIGMTLFILVMDTWIMPAYTNYNEGVTVPDVTKVSLQEAETILERYGLRHEVLDRRAHSAYPADYILDQSPSPRQIVKPNRKVYLTVNTAVRPTVVVPNVVNMSLRNARIQLENYGLTVGQVSYESGRFRSQVLRQSIAAGDTVDANMVVDLAVSDGLGDEIVTVPEIVGLSLPEAQQKLREAGLRVEEIQFQPSRDVTPNTILARSPQSNEVREGQALVLIVSERFDAREESERGVIISDTTETDTLPPSIPDTTDQNQNN